MTDAATALTLERALTVGGIGRAPSGELSPVTRQIYATQYGKACAWKRAVLHSASRTFTPEQVAQYALHLVEQGYARATAGLAVRAIRWGHRVAGVPVPDGVPASYVLRAQDSTDDLEAVNAPPRRDPSELLSAFAAACKPGEPKGCRDLAIVNLLYWTGYPVETLSGLNVLNIGPQRDGCVDVTPVDRAGVRVRHTDEDGHHGTLCPVCTVGRWADMLHPATGDLSVPFLRAVDKAGNIAGIDRHGGTKVEGGRLHPKNINAVVLRSLADRAGLLDVLVSPARALRLAGACAAYVRGDVDLAGAARRAGYTPGSQSFTRHLLELTAPSGKEHQ